MCYKNNLGTEYFYISANKLYSNEFLDRDTIGGPKGTGPRVKLVSKCIVYDEDTGDQYTMEKTLHVDVLDEDDNPPVTQVGNDVEVHLKDFTLVSFFK